MNRKLTFYHNNYTKILMIKGNTHLDKIRNMSYIATNKEYLRFILSRFSGIAFMWLVRRLYLFARYFPCGV